MISLDFHSVFTIAPPHGITSDEFHLSSRKLTEYLSRIQSLDEGFDSVIDDRKTIASINDFASSIRGRYRYIVVLGIGGSALGTRCLYDSLSSHSQKVREDLKKPHLHLLDTIDPSYIAAFEAMIEYPSTLFIVVSKSGETIETLAQYSYFRAKCESLGLNPSEHFLFVTDAKHGVLQSAQGLKHFTIPVNVAGRFSVLTVVSLLPAALIGIDIHKVLTGACFMRDRFLSPDFHENLPFQLAALQYLFYQKSKTIHVLMPYCERLASFTDWYCQLVAESLGKRYDRDGREVYTGITPFGALGVKDQHSKLQLFLEGPNDKFFIFIQIKNVVQQLKIPRLVLPNTAPVNTLFEDVSFAQLMQIEQQATLISLTEQNRPSVTVTIDKMSAESLGGLFFLFEGATVFLAEFFNVDAFNQPGVEKVKEIIRGTCPLSSPT